MLRTVAPLIACAIANAPVHAGFTPYSNAFRTVTAPAIAPGSFGVAGTALADGRLLAMTGDGFYLETAVGSATFALASTLDASITDATDPGFLAVSPDGSTIALGTGFNRPLITFDAALLDAGTTISSSNANVFALDHFAGTWMDNSTLAITGQDGVTAVNTTTGDTSILINNFDGASAGIAFDSTGTLYTANGFDFAPGGTETGEIRAFTPADLATGTADFQTNGTFIAEILSASPLHFDTAGNLIAAGGDFSAGDSGYVGVFNMTTAELAQYDPVGTGTEFYSAFVNHATGELVVQNGSDWFIYSVPAPSALALFAIAAIGRRRHAN